MTTTREEAIELALEAGFRVSEIKRPNGIVFIEIKPVVIDQNCIVEIERLIDLAKSKAKAEENEAIAQEYESAGWTFQAEAIRARMKP